MLLINMVFYIPADPCQCRYALPCRAWASTNLQSFAGVCEMIGRSVVAFSWFRILVTPQSASASPVAWILADLFLVPAYLYCAQKRFVLFEKMRR